MSSAPDPSSFDVTDRSFAAEPELRLGPDPGQGRYGILTLLCLSAAIAYVQRAALSVPAAEIARDLRLADLARDMGWVQSVWYFCYALMQLPSGWLADRLGSRRTLALFCVLWSIATGLSGLATDYGSLLVLWGLMGAAQAGAFPCAAKAIGQLFPDSERARASGLLASGMAVGGALAPVLTASLLESLVPLADRWEIDRWRLLFATFAIPGLLWTFAFLLLVPANRLPVSLPTVRSSEGVAAPLPWSRLLTSGSLALLCGQQFFRAAGMVFFLTWFPTFLQKTRGVSSLESGLLTTIAGVGGVVGSLAGGFASDELLRRTGNPRLSRQGIAVVGMGSCALLIVLSYFLTDVRASIGVISLGAFCATFGGVSGYTVAIKFGGRHVATVFSSMNMCGNIGAALFPVTAGWLVARTGNWNLILFLFAAIMAVDALCWAVLNPRGSLAGETDDAE
ncbi:MFS transporter [Planctomyces sp. SH-PL14]|uniref:MFS transporter n=1 Tax=Planctomyces sp. SH-PL14 TaxID=1632864 RepID=UPI00078C1961|nr:MFS transporter [Planctomyces sp. SH-PL14]AMV19141.1 putative sulfoacetate transporter SauU [Planctomyces sp. SH-PL14]